MLNTCVMNTPLLVVTGYLFVWWGSVDVVDCCKAEALMGQFILDAPRGPSGHKWCSRVYLLEHDPMCDKYRSRSELLLWLSALSALIRCNGQWHAGLMLCTNNASKDSVSSYLRLWAPAQIACTSAVLALALRPNLWRFWIHKACHGLELVGTMISEKSTIIRLLSLPFPALHLLLKKGIQVRHDNVAKLPW